MVSRIGLVGCGNISDIYLANAAIFRDIAFVDAVIDGRPMPVSARDGRQALRLADAALESAETGRLVKV